MALDLYEIGIDFNDPTTAVTSNSLVLYPAHEIDFQTFQKFSEVQPIKYHFDDEKQVITGVAISADTKIYRRDTDGYEYEVVFRKKGIFTIMQQIARDEYFNRLNLDHQNSNKVDDALMVMFYQIDAEKGFTAPERFKDANDGSLVLSYKIQDKELYERAKNGDFKGFSVEGFFITKKIEMSKKKFNKPVNTFGAVIRQVHKWDMNVSADTIEMGTELIYVDEDGDEWGRVESGEYELEDGRLIQVNGDGVVVLIGDSEFKKVIDEHVDAMDELINSKQK